MSKLTDKISACFYKRAIPILCYHSVPHGCRFRAQMDWIRAAGYRVISLEEACNWVRRPQVLEAPSLVLTFDDCYFDQFANAVPALRHSGIRHFFAVSNWVMRGQVRPNRSDVPAAAAALMGPTEVSELRRLGFTVGCHGRTHTPFSVLSSEAQRAEIHSAKQDLEELLREEVRFFCFPHGHHSSQSVEHLKTSGFQAAVSARVGVRPHDSLFTMKRLCVSASASVADLRARLTWMPPAAEIVRRVPHLERLARAIWTPA